MTTVNLGVLIISENFNEKIINTINSVKDYASLFIIGVIANDENNVVLSLLKEWGNSNQKKVLVLLSNDENFNKNGYGGLAQELLNLAEKLDYENKLNYVLYLKAGEIVNNISTLPEILSNIHENVQIQGLKLSLLLKDNIEESVRLIKLPTQIKANGWVEPELVIATGIAKIPLSSDILNITACTLDIRVLNMYKFILESALKKDNTDINALKNLAKFINSKYYQNIITLSPLSPLSPESYEAYLNLAVGDKQYEYAEKAFSIKKHLEPLIIIVKYFMEKKNYEFAFLFARKMIDINESSTLSARNYIRWKLLAQIGLELNVSLTHPDSFIYGKEGATKMLYATNDISMDQELLKQYKNLESRILPTLDIFKKFELSVRENLAMLQEPKLALGNAIQDIKVLL